MWSSAAPKRFFSAGRVWDVLAIVAIAFAVWKMFLYPRSLLAARSLPAPRAVYERLDGGAFRLSDQRGRLVFLDFYTTWCEPCKLELPLVEAWSRSHPNSVVVPVDVGERRPIAAAFARRFGLRDVALDPAGSAEALFSIQGFPTVVVVDSAAYIRAKWEGLNPAIALAMSNAEKKL